MVLLPSNYILYNVWGEITYPLPNNNGCTVEVSGCFTEHVIGYPYWD